MNALLCALANLARLRWLGAAFCALAMLCVTTHALALVGATAPARVDINASSGQVAQRIDYDAFGQVTADSHPSFQPFGFAGGLYDPDTGLVRFGARDYDPELGRFTNPDPILFGGGQANLYVYAGNDPLNFVDPSGHWAFLIPLAVGALEGAAMDVGLQLATHGGNWDCIHWGEVGIQAGRLRAWHLGVPRSQSGGECCKGGSGDCRASVEVRCIQIRGQVGRSASKAGLDAAADHRSHPER